MSRTKAKPNYRLKSNLAAPVRVAVMNIEPRSVDGPIGFFKTHFGPAVNHVTIGEFLQGGVVNHHCVTVVSRFLNANAGQPFPFDTGPFAIAAIATETHERTTAKYRRMRQEIAAAVHHWVHGWISIFMRGFDQACVGDHHALAIDESDVRDMASVMCHSAGRHTLKNLECPDDVSLAVGEAFFGASLGQMQDWLVKVWDVAPLSVVHCQCHDKARRPFRVGTSVILPVTKEAFARYCQGDLGIFEISQEDIRYPAGHLIVVAISNRVHTHPLDPADVQNAQARAALFQAVMQFPFTPLRPRHLKMATFEAFPQNIERTRTLGFLPNSMLVKGRTWPIAVLSKPWGDKAVDRKGRLAQIRQYGSFLAVVLAVQASLCSTYYSLRRGN